MQQAAKQRRQESSEATPPRFYWSAKLMNSLTIRPVLVERKRAKIAHNF